MKVSEVKLLKDSVGVVVMIVAVIKQENRQEFCFFLRLTF